VLLGLAPVLAAPAAHADWAVNLTQGVDQVSRDIYGLHMLAFWWCVGIAVVVFGFMIYSMVRYRHSKGAVADTSLTHNVRVEVIWTTIPILILISMAVPAARVLVTTTNTSGSKLSIQITGYQWRWTYEYVGTGVKFVSSLDRESNAARQLGSDISPYSVPNYLLNVDNPLVVPAGVKVRVLITGGDVIHSWWVPALGIKKDAIPGYVNEAWFDVDPDKTGTYRGQCAELCGRDHGFMPIVVKVVSPADFQKWLKQQQAAPRQDIAADQPDNANAAPPAIVSPSATRTIGAPSAAPSAPAPATGAGT
jgi:cytochrome c oxidase subunit 2